MAAAAAVGSPAATLWGDDSTVRLPFENGERPLVKYPQKRPLIRLTTRPPQLETPFEVFQDGVITPNDAFFVRYHLTQSPPRRELLLPGAFQLQIKGKVSKPLTFSIEELKARFENVEVVAVNQCSGNSRGFFQPRVPGGQLGNGAMGCARWRGVRLADVLKAAEPMPEAAQILLNGLDLPALPQTPDFVKSIPFDLGLSSEPVLAFEMNGEPLPWLNGFPLRLVVPGYYGTYWVKHLNEITVIDSEFKGFWMNPAYRIPDDPCAHIPPGTTAKRTIPISRLNVRSFITSPLDGAVLKAGVSQRVRGIAFDGGGQLREVAISSDNGRTWRAADLGPDAGRFAFREWTFSWSPPAPGEYSLLVRATNRLGESQPMEPLWNPSGYMRNVVEATKVTVA
jgi:DMSO/TMAO reductase YedYZ molybdopterin-dependent catalytic subunit